MWKKFVDLVLTEEIASDVITAIIAIAGTLMGMALQSRIERKNRQEALFVEDRKRTYAKVMSNLRLDKPWDDPDLNESMNEAILLSSGQLRRKLVMAIKSTDGDWEEKYGMRLADALDDLEVEMKRALGIEKNAPKWMKFKNWTIKSFSGRELRTQKAWPFITYWEKSRKSSNESTDQKIVSNSKRATE